MATGGVDALLLLRQSVVGHHEFISVASPESTDRADLAQATHMRFLSGPEPTIVPLDTPTRFEVAGSPAVNLRSVAFAWEHKDDAIPIYDAAAKELNEKLPKGSDAVHLFAFVERLDLITWLEGASDDSEYIKPVVGGQDVGAGGVGGVVGAAGEGATAAAGLTGTSAGGALNGTTADAAVASRAGKGLLDPRMATIYGGERRMGDRNTALRGSKTMDFSGIRKLAATFLRKAQHPSATAISNNPSLAINAKPARRPDPIILLSPSASSLLRLSNIRDFLDTGRFHPTDNTASASMLHITRVIRDVDPNRPMRFILVEGPEQFKPEYWNRVVAVFTTGQTWQFKNYKWNDPAELFKHVMGVYVGWRGEQPPDTVRGWGHRVNTFGIDKWRDPAATGLSTQADSSRWRDREVVESIWKAIGGNMRAKGWKHDTAPTTV